MRTKVNAPDNLVSRTKQAGDRNARPCVFLMTDQLRVGGTERQFVALANSLDRDSFQLRKLGCLLQKCGPFLSALGEITEFQRRRRQLLSKGAFQSYRKLALRHLRAHGVAIAQAFDFYSDVMLIPVARLAGVPVCDRRLPDRWPTASPLFSLPAWFASFRCVTVSCAIRKAAASAWRTKEFPSTKLVVIGNGLPKEAFVETPPALIPSAHVMRVGMIGRMNETVKNHALLLRAAAILAGRFTNLEFVLAGDGQLRPSLENMARELGIGKRVQFLGERQDIPAVLAALDISVVPSFSESLSNVIMESMAAGKPVIASRVGGNAELVREGETGLLVSPHDEKELAGAIAYVLENAAARSAWGQNGRTTAMADFALASMRDRYQQLYLQLLEASGARKKNRPTVSVPAPATQRILRVAIVAPSTRKLGGQSVQADLLMRSWQNDPELEAFFVPTDAELPGWLAWAEQIAYLRTVVRAPSPIGQSCGRPRALWRSSTSSRPPIGLFSLLRHPHGSWLSCEAGRASSIIGAVKLLII